MYILKIEQKNHYQRENSKQNNYHHHQNLKIASKFKKKKKKLYIYWSRNGHLSKRVIWIFYPEFKQQQQQQNLYQKG